MSEKENAKWGKGNAVPKKVQLIVKNRFQELQNTNDERIKNGLKKLSNEQIYSDINKLTNICRTKIISIIKNPISSPKKTGPKKFKYDYERDDIEKIDDIIKEFNVNNVSPTMSDVYKK